MPSWVLQSLGRFGLLVFSVLLMTALLLFAIPGSSVLGRYDRGVSQEELQELQAHEGGLERVLRLMPRVLVLDLGVSRVSGEEIRPEAFKRLFSTLKLSLVAGAGFIILGVLAALLSILFLKTEPWLNALSSLILAMPSFGIGAILILVFLIYGNLAFFSQGPLGMLLPAMTAGLRPAAQLYRVLRQKLQEILGMPFILTARMKGLSEWEVHAKHALRAAAAPALALAGSEMGQLMTGAVVAETLFARKGLGTWILQGIGNRDPEVLLASVFLSALGVALMNLLADLLMGFMDPRLKKGEVCA